MEVALQERVNAVVHAPPLYVDCLIVGRLSFPRCSNRCDSVTMPMRSNALCEYGWSGHALPTLPTSCLACRFSPASRVSEHRQVSGNVLTKLPEGIFRGLSDLKSL